MKILTAVVRRQLITSFMYVSACLLRLNDLRFDISLRLPPIDRFSPHKDVYRNQGQRVLIRRAISPTSMNSIMACDSSVWNGSKRSKSSRKDKGEREEGHSMRDLAFPYPESR